MEPIILEELKSKLCNFARPMYLRIRGVRGKWTSNGSLKKLLRIFRLI